MIVIATNVACTGIIRIKVIARFRSISREIIYWAFITTIVMRSWITASINRGAGRECTLVTVTFRRHVIRILPIISRHTLSVRFGFCRYERSLSVPPEPRGSIKRVCWFLSWQITRSRPNRAEKPRSFVKIKANGGEMRCSSCDRYCFL